MPAPVATYVVGVSVVIAGAATVYVVKQHVWDPHVRPKFDQWVHDVRMKVKARKLQRRGSGVVPILAHPQISSFEDDDDPAQAPSERNVEMKAVEMLRAYTSGLETAGSPSFRGHRSELDAPNVSLSTPPLIPTPVRSPSPGPPFVVEDLHDSIPEGSLRGREANPSFAVPSSPSSVSLDSFASLSSSRNASVEDLATLQARAFGTLGPESFAMPAPSSPSISETFSFASAVASPSMRSTDLEHRSGHGSDGYQSDSHWISVEPSRTS